MHRVLPSGLEYSGERRKLYRVKAHRLEHRGGLGARARAWKSPLRCQQRALAWARRQAIGRRSL
jgi:hypothetical protein